MSSSLSLRFSHPVQPWVLEQIVALLQEIAGEQGVVLAQVVGLYHSDLHYPDLHYQSAPSQWPNYVIVISPDFSALVLVQPVQSDYQIRFSFVPSEIEQFVQSLPNPPRHERIQVNQALAQTEFTAKLLEILTAEHPEELDRRSFPEIQSLAEQAQLLNQVTQAIRQSLELPSVLQTAVQQVRAFLQVDRLLIHQFGIAAPACDVDFGDVDVPTPSIARVDGITYEARAHDQIPPVLHQMGDHWVNAAHYLRDKYRSGDIIAKNPDGGIPELAQLVKFPEDASVQSELTTPILVQGELWGLLIAHQCSYSRQWEDLEKQFLQQIVDHLSIAIYQAKLFGQLQEQANTLERVVAERTQELRDTLVIAQAADRAKSEFLATMSHELRTPLTCIIGMSSTLLRNPDQRLLPIERQQSHLQIIHDRGTNLLTLINDILELSNIESGRTVLNIRNFSLAQMANQILKECEPKAIQKQIRLVLDITPENGHQSRFNADPQRVRQILLNLLGNAIKFTPAGGEVTLKIRLFHQAVMLQVEDTGIGIPIQKQNLLFQKFQQIDSSYQRKYEGTGLGLALTKQLVELHGGTIELTSQENVGSTFTVKLPEQILSEIALVRERLKLPVYARILLIEAIEEQANLICDLLTAADYQVIWMTDAETAIYQMQAIQPLITIFNCQHLQAEQMLSRLKQATQEVPTKILALIPDGTDGDRYKQLGADDYLSQAIAQPEQLIDKVTVLTNASP